MAENLNQGNLISLFKSIHSAEARTYGYQKNSNDNKYFGVLSAYAMSKFRIWWRQNLSIVLSAPNKSFQTSAYRPLYDYKNWQSKLLYSYGFGNHSKIKPCTYDQACSTEVGSKIDRGQNTTIT